MDQYPKDQQKSRSTRIFLFAKAYANFINRWQPLQPEAILTKKFFKVTDYIFKITSWIALLSLIKFVYDKTHSTPVYIAYQLLSALLFGLFFYACMAVNFQFFSEKSHKTAVLNLLGNLLISGVLISGTWFLVVQIVAAIENSK